MSFLILSPTARHSNEWNGLPVDSSQAICGSVIRSGNECGTDYKSSLLLFFQVLLVPWFAFDCFDEENEPQKKMIKKEIKGKRVLELDAEIRID